MPAMKPTPGTEGTHTIALDVAFMFGDVVYLKTDPDARAGMVTALHLRPNGLAYSVTWGESRVESTHYAFELISERPL